MCSFRGSGDASAALRGGLSCIGRRDGPRAAAMQPRSVPIAGREPTTRAADVKPSCRDAFKTRTHFGRQFLSSISRCVHAHTCLSELETACRSAHIPQHQRNALLAAETPSARAKTASFGRASRRPSPLHTPPPPATTQNDGRRQEEQGLPLPPAPGVVVRRQNADRVRLPHDEQCARGVPSCGGAFTPSTRIVFRNDGRGWFVFEFEAVRTAFDRRCSAQVRRR